MSLNVSDLGKDIAAAFVSTLKSKVPDIKDFATSEAKKLAQTLGLIEKLVLAGKIDEDEAKLHLEIQKNATRTVLLTMEGLGILAVEAAINAGLEVVRKAVNSAVKFALL